MLGAEARRRALVKKARGGKNGGLLAGEKRTPTHA